MGVLRTVGALGRGPASRQGEGARRKFLCGYALDSSSINGCGSMELPTAEDDWRDYSGLDRLGIGARSQGAGKGRINPNRFGALTVAPALTIVPFRGIVRLRLEARACVSRGRRVPWNPMGGNL